MQNEPIIDEIIDELMLCKGNVNCILTKLKKMGLYDVTFTLEEVAKILNITRERVRQIEMQAIRHIKLSRSLREYVNL